MSSPFCSACGHPSGDPDFCSECGADLHAPAVPAQPARSPGTAQVAETGAAVPALPAAEPVSGNAGSGATVNSARPGAALSVVQRRFGSGVAGGALVYSDLATERPCFNCGQMMRKTANFCSHCRAPKETRLSGRYRFAGIVGGGGMGGVLGIEDMNLVDISTGHGRLLVAKYALPNPDPDLAEQARRERQFLVSIDHPRLVKVIDLLTFGGKDWIVMELVAGEDLAAVQRTLGQPIAVVDALRYAIEVCEALAYLHTLPRPIIYRDLKADNVMLMPSGEIKIVDLGGAKVFDRTALKDDIAIGTEGYYAPEARGGLTDERSDLYSLGRTLLALVLGDGWRAAAEPPGVPERARFAVLRRYRMLYDLLARACALKPDERYQVAADMADDLRAVLRSIAGATAGVTAAQRFTATMLAGPGVSTPVAAVPEGDPAAPVLQAGDQLMQVGRADRALPVYESAVKQYPRSIDALCRRAIAQAATGMKNAAANDVQQAKTAAPTSWRPRWAAAQLALRAGDWTGALEPLRSVVRVLPGEAPPLLALAAALRETGQFDEAIETYALLLEGDPQNGEALYELGLAYRRANDLPRALDAFNKVPASDGRSVAARIAYVDAALALGDPAIVADEAAQVASALHRDVGDLAEVQELWARYCYAAARLAHERKLPSGGVKLVDGAVPAAVLIKLGDGALRAAVRKTTPGSSRRATLAALWRQRPWTLL